MERPTSVGKVHQEATLKVRLSWLRWNLLVKLHLALGSVRPENSNRKKVQGQTELQSQAWYEESKATTGTPSLAVEHVLKCAQSPGFTLQCCKEKSHVKCCNYGFLHEAGVGFQEYFKQIDY